MDSLDKQLGFGSRVSIVPGSTRKFLGIDIEKEHGGDIVLSQKSYLVQCNTDSLWTLLRKKRPAKIRALTSKDVELEEGEEGDGHWEGPLRAVLGTLQWAVRLNPLRTVWASIAAKSVSKPSRKVFKGVVRLIDMLKAWKEGRRFSSVGDTPHIHCFTDCGRHAATYTGRMGWLVRILPGPQGVKIGVRV
uniref:Reverse transcriptase Ty1/copia-type domain-containing protein n=1 Tax=Chromera velia CCMP2878 TaxID=1169474 RepID=A0A0G4G0D7_9ALVE|eukprot:Cvel_3963.t1-p1 / transcript=Cvel_3963.t1 / gene=Cvel_3963 / organism=Chromera_velia_CCMP2878 / gene_product=hypothetical protein / transcript_product=hypothetical protein / location=Cvel_scaffold168:50400-50966(+) / protein_length=189 / sequence_SO=supercontig / SO=protein_coding / is_pseudo=false